MRSLQISLYVMTLLLCGAILVSGTPLQAGPDKNQMNAKEFETWIIQIANTNQNSPQPTFCQSVLNRLNADKYVTDRAISTCVEAYVAAGENSARNAEARVAQHRFDAAEQFINELLPLVSDRPELVAQLLTRKGSLAVALGNFQNAADSFQQSLNVIEPIRLDSDLQRLTTLVKLGQSLLSLNRKKAAEDYFLQALSYPWYTIVNHPDEQRNLRDQYVLAGYGLIESRRGDLAALQQIVFVPATQNKLGAALEKAIQEAKGPRQ